MLKRTLFPILAITLLGACGKPGNAPTAAPAAAPAAATVTSTAPGSGGEDVLAKGEHIYKGTCAACHATGLAGAPKFGNKADWGPRIAQGKETLYSHALKGFTGTKGTMPPKGANPGLSDSDVKAAVDYMAAQIK